MTNRSDVRFEFRSGKVRQGPPVYVSYRELLVLKGYQSQYGVLKKQADFNTQAGQTKGVTYEVYCDTLLVDFDACVHRADFFDGVLCRAGIAFLRGVSGGRSDHFHIPIDPMFGTDVPYSCKAWILQNAPGADTSVYHRNGMFRLFGTIHEKTGRPKILTKTVQGQRLHIEYQEEAPRVSYSTGHVSDLESALSYALSLCGNEPTMGTRHQQLWSLAKSLADATNQTVSDPAGLVFGLLQAVNANWANKKDTDDIHRIVRDLKL